MKDAYENMPEEVPGKYSFFMKTYKQRAWGDFTRLNLRCLMLIFIIEVVTEGDTSMLFYIKIIINGLKKNGFL